MKKRVGKEHTRSLQRAWDWARSHRVAVGVVFGGIAAVLVFLSSLFGLGECLTRVPTSQAAPELEKVSFGLVRRIALDSALASRIVTLEIHGADEVQFCGRPVATGAVATIDVVAPTNLSVALPPNANEQGAPPDVTELSFGSDAPWTVDVELVRDNQIHLAAKASRRAAIDFYARPRATLGKEFCDDGRVPATAQGSAVRLIVHLRPSDAPGERWPTGKLLGEIWPNALAGVLKTGASMSAILTRFRSCNWHTTNQVYERFSLQSTATSPMDLHEPNARISRGEIVVRRLLLSGTSLIPEFEWDPNASWDGTGDCSCRCRHEAKEALEAASK